MHYLSFKHFESGTYLEESAGLWWEFKPPGVLTGFTFLNQLDCTASVFEMHKAVI